LEDEDFEQTKPLFSTSGADNIMSQTELTKLAMALGILYGVYKFVPHPAAKAAALGVAGTVIAKRTPVLKDYI
jgi:fructose/tagatose bisphosphate aldolase